MNSTQKRDIKYSFIGSLNNPLHSQIIDDSWRKEKFQNLDIILPTWITQEKLNSDQNENDPYDVYSQDSTREDQENNEYPDDDEYGD